MVKGGNVKTVLALLVVLTSLGNAQIFQRDTVRYADSSTVTTTWKAIYVGTKGVWKYVDISFDVSSSNQTALFLFGAATDTNNPKKKNVMRLSKNTVYNAYPTMEDTLWIKTLGGSVPVSVIAKPIPPIQPR
jgi:hypothetical protein